jgi:hypothetical protein
MLGTTPTSVNSALQRTRRDFRELELGEFIQSLPFWGGPIKLVPTRANGQPAFGYYVRDPSADLYRAVGLLVVGLRQDRICSLTRFGDKGLLGRFGLPRTLSDDTPA